MTLLYVTIAVFAGIALFMPKRLSALEVYTSVLFALTLNLTIDLIMNLHLNLYGYFKKGIDPAGYWIVYAIAPLVTFIFLNGLTHMKSKKSKVAYTLGWSAFSIAYEVFGAKPSGMLYYESWKWWYSALAYPFLFLLLAVHLALVRKCCRSSPRE